MRSPKAGVVAADVTSATDAVYPLTGTTLSEPVSLALTPAGLLILQPSHARILRVPP